MKGALLTDISRPKQWPTLSLAEMKQSGFPVYGANGKIGRYNAYTHERPTILIGCRGSCGTLHISEPRSYVNGNAMALDNLDDERVHMSYLFHYLSFRGFEDVVSGSSQPQITREALSKVWIPLFDLPEQQRLAAILNKADAIRCKRREALKLADEFLRSSFLDLFGDPVLNPKGWPKDNFGNLGTLDRGKSRHRPRDEPALYGGPHPFIQTGDVANCDGVVRRYTQTYSELGLSQSRKWPAGTLAITIAANIGKTGILGFDACFPDSVVGFTAKPPVTAEFIQFWLSQIQSRLEEAAPQSAQKNINLEILRDLPVPVPPEGLLRTFTALVRRTRESKLRQEAMLRESDLLFGSIQQRAFNGEMATA
jgi:type I restriction enzyme S subunit